MSPRFAAAMTHRLTSAVALSLVAAVAVPSTLAAQQAPFRA